MSEQPFWVAWGGHLQPAAYFSACALNFCSDVSNSGWTREHPAGLTAPLQVLATKPRLAAADHTLCSFFQDIKCRCCRLREHAVKWHFEGGPWPDWL